MAKPASGATGNDYAFSLSNQSNTALRCITVQFNTQADGNGFTPTGFNAAGATFSGSFMSTWSSWAAANAGGTAKVTHSSGAAPATSSGVQLMLSGITNGSTADTPVFALIETFSNIACTTAVDSSTVSFSWTDNTEVNATIDPAMTFIVDPINGGSCNGAAVTGVGTTPVAVSLGTVNKTSRAIGGQRLSVASNAGGGASVYPGSTVLCQMATATALLPSAPTPTTRLPSLTPGLKLSATPSIRLLSVGDPNRFSGTRWASINNQRPRSRLLPVFDPAHHWLHRLPNNDFSANRRRFLRKQRDVHSGSLVLTR